MKNKKLYVNLAYVAYDTTFSIANNAKQKNKKHSYAPILELENSDIGIWNE